MTLLWTLAAVAAHWRRHPLELGTLLIGLALATALWTGVQALNAEARAAYDRAAAVLAGDRFAAVVSRDGQRFPLEAYVRLRRAGWPVAPLLTGEIRRDAASLQVIGVDPLTLPPEVQTLAIGGGDQRFADFITPPNLGLVAPETWHAATALPDLPPLAVAERLPPETLLVDIGVAEQLLDARGQVSRLIVPPEAGGWALPPPLAERLRIVPPRQESDLERLTASFHLNLTAFGSLSFMVGLFIVYSAAGLAFEQRKPIFRSLRACGVSARGLALCLGLELGALALLAGALGVAGGYLIAAALLPDVAASLRGLYGARVPGSLTFGSGWWWLAGLGMSLAGAIAAVGGGIWRAVRLPVLAAAHPQAWAAAERQRQRLQGAAAGVIALGGVGALVWGRGAAAGFAVMGGLLLAAALALPILLARLVELGRRRARRPLTEWAWADARQQLSGLSLALMALLLALAVNVGVGTMVASFRSTFLGWLDQRLAAEIYVTARDQAQAEAIAAWAAARPDVTAVLPIWSVDIRLGDWPTEIYGFRDHATYRDAWPLIEARTGAWDAVAAGEAALVSEQLARRHGLRLGDTVELPAPAGTWAAVVAGIYADYGNPEGHVMVAGNALAAHWPELRRNRLALRTAPDAADGVLASLRARFGLDATQAVDQAALKAASRRIFERTFAVTVALNALTMTVAGIALFTSLLTLANLRLVQVAPLWALGVRRRVLAATLMAQTLVLALATALVALPLGLAVAWILTDVVNVAAFGWKLPVELYPRQWLALVLLALATAGAAALIPVLRLRQARPADLLRGFSNER